MSEVRAIKARHADGTIEDCSIETVDGTWDLIFSGAGIHRQRFSDKDLFEAFTALRKALEQNGVLLLCAGARPDVFPSGMSRDMSGGRKAYITKIGHPASERVDIFADADAALVGNVSEQLSFHSKWMRSLQKSS